MRSATRTRSGPEGASTLVLIAYRKATIALADEVLFLSDGRIADRGSHADLLSRNPAYARLVNAYEEVTT
jgi:ATP-binding cassette, subfamily B, bacterial